MFSRWLKTLKEHMEIVGAIGVIFGIVLVILQLKQNEELLRFQIATELRVNRDNERLSKRDGDYPDVLAKLQANETLSPSELQLFNATAMSIASELDLRRMLAEVGIFKGNWRDWLMIESCDLLNNYTGRAWHQYHQQFNSENTDQLDNEILSELSRRLNECPISFGQYLQNQSE